MSSPAYASYMSHRSLDYSGARQSCPVISTSKINLRGLTIEVPCLLPDCMDYIFTNGLVEGAFRISGSARRMKDVTQNYSLYHAWLYSEEKRPHIHDVCGIVKRYLREYLDSINGLFSPRVLQDLRQEYIGSIRKPEESSDASFKSANTSVGSQYSLLSIAELETEPFAVDAESLMDAIAQSLMINNLESKNLFFIYWLSVMKQLSLHQEKTKMSISNLSIIFQPYLFQNTSLDDLPKFRAILTLLVQNFDLFLDRFIYYEEIIGGLHSYAQDEMSISPVGSTAASPLTVYSSSQGSLPKAAYESGRKSSISNRLSLFWDNYNIPISRPKRMSFLSAKSNDKFASSENLGIDNYFITPVKEKRQPENFNVIPTVQEPPASSPLEAESDKGDYFFSSHTASNALQLPSNATKRNKRKSFMELFRSTLSLNSQDNLCAGLPVSPLTPNSLGLGIPAQLLNDSTDDLNAPGPAHLNPEGKKSVGRSFSLRFKRKSKS